MKIPSKNNYCKNVIRAKHRGKEENLLLVKKRTSRIAKKREPPTGKKEKTIDLIYSMTEPGYQGWLADGNKGSFENFLEAQAKVSDKKYLIEKIVAELKEMNITELKELLDVIYDRNF